MPFLLFIFVVISVNQRFNYFDILCLLSEFYKKAIVCLLIKTKNFSILGTFFQLLRLSSWRQNFLFNHFVVVFRHLFNPGFHPGLLLLKPFGLSIQRSILSIRLTYHNLMGVFLEGQNALTSPPNLKILGHAILVLCQKQQKLGRH